MRKMREPKPTSDFVIATNGHCFLCLNHVTTEITSTSSSAIKFETDVQPEPSPIMYSLECLVRFLKMDMRKVFKKGSTVSDTLRGTVQDSNLKVELCYNCSILTERFSELSRRLEKIRIEVEYCLNEIYQRLLFVNTANMKERLINVADSETSTQAYLIEEVEIVEVLRKEAENQCLKKLTCPLPRIKVCKLTEDEIIGETGNSKSESWNDPSDEVFPDTGFKHDCEGSATNDDNLGRKSPTSVSDYGGSDYANESNDVDTSTSSDAYEPDNKQTSTSSGSLTKLPTRREPGPMQSRPRNQSGNIVSSGKSLTSAKDKVANVLQSVPPALETGGTSGKSQGQYSIASGGRHQCLLCPGKFSNRWNFDIHYKTIHLKRRFNCGACGNSYPYKYAYQRHYLNVHVGVKYRCVECNQTFTQQQGLDNHTKTVHLGEGPRFKCRFCLKTYRHSRHRNNHMEKHHPEIFLRNSTPRKPAHNLKILHSMDLT